MTNHVQLLVRCIARASQKYGSGWRLLSDEQRAGAIALEALAVISANDENEGWQKASSFAHAVLKLNGET